MARYDKMLGSNDAHNINDREKSRSAAIVRRRAQRGQLLVTDNEEANTPRGGH